MEKLATTLIAMRNKATYSYKFKLPITEMCGLKVVVQMWIGLERAPVPEYPHWEYVALDISSTLSFVDNDGDLCDHKLIHLTRNLDNLDVMHVKEKIHDLLTDANTLVYDKFNSSFKQPDDVIDFSFLSEFKNLKWLDECCVCHEQTNFKTCCNHTVCIECMSKIKPARDEDRECNMIMCPLCREPIAHP